VGHPAGHPVFCLVLSPFTDSTHCDSGHDGVARTRAFEPLVLGAAALPLAGLVHTAARRPTACARTTLLWCQRLHLRLPMAVFGVQHFMYCRLYRDLNPVVDSGSSGLGLFYRCPGFNRGRVSIAFRGTPFSQHPAGMMFVVDHPSFTTPIGPRPAQWN